MLINAQRPEEVRIAIVSDGILDQYEVAATESGLCRGNIYRGVVANVQPSLDAAFVDYGEEKDGLLRADDVIPSAFHKKLDGGGRHPRVDRPADSRAGRARRDRPQGRIGHDQHQHRRTVPGADALRRRARRVAQGRR